MPWWYIGITVVSKRLMVHIPCWDYDTVYGPSILSRAWVCALRTTLCSAQRACTWKATKVQKRRDDLHYPAQRAHVAEGMASMVWEIQTPQIQMKIR